MKRSLMNGGNRFSMMCYMPLDSKETNDMLGNPITYYNNAEFSKGKFGNGMSRGKAFCRIYGLNFRDKTFTCSVWIKVVSQVFEVGCGVYINTSPDRVCQIGFNVNYTGNIGDITALICNSSGNSWVDYTTRMGNIPNDGLFHHVAMTYSNTILSVYVDGVRSYKSSVTFPFNGDMGYVLVHSEENALIMDDYMLTEEVLWDDNFVPPTKPFN